MALAARIRRGLKGGVKATTLNGSAAQGAATITCTDLSTWAAVNANGPSTAVINRGQSDEEVISFTGISGNTLTGVGRGEAGTTDQLHISGTVEHGTSRIDADEANELVAAMAKNSCRVYNSVGISIPDSVMTYVTFDSERFDTGGMHDASLPGRLVCKTAGKYLIIASIDWFYNATGHREAVIRLNGATQIDASAVTSGGGAGPALTLSTIWSMAVDDYVELGLAQTSGGDLIALGGTVSYGPELSMAFIGF